MGSTISIAQLNLISLQFNRYLALGLLLFGTVGNILSCLVFSQRKLRSNPCVIYFLIASLSNLISLISGIPSRMLRDWNILSDLTDTSAFLCKLRLFVLFTTRTIAAWLLVCATIDRFLVSSKELHLRRLSSIKQASRCIVGVCLGSLLFWSESLYCFDANLIDTPIKCYAKSAACRILNDLSQSFVTTIIPSCLMLAFGLGTISHIHQTQLVHPKMMHGGGTITPAIRSRKTDNSLALMLFLQVILLTVFNIPQAIQKFYLTYTFDQSKSAYQRALENLIFAIALLCTYIPNCLPFYLYTISGTVFRRTLFELVGRIKCTVK
jgi:hypothetical protein